MNRVAPAQRRRNAVPRGCPLSAREYEVLALLSEGMTQQQAARKLGRAHSTVRAHTHTAYGRLGVNNLPQALMKMTAEGWAGVVPLNTAGSELSPFLQAYLAAFDSHLRTRTPRSRLGMRIALMGAANDKGARIGSKPLDDPLDRILDSIVGGV